MKMIGGTYGEGYVLKLSGELQISPTSAWRPKIRKISEIIHFEDVDKHITSGISKAGIGAVAGYLLAGPLAGVMGMAIGASKGTSTKFVFGIGFANGDAVMIAASYEEYSALKSAAAPYIAGSFQKTRQTKPRANNARPKASAKKNKANSKPTIISGREKKRAPTPSNSMMSKLNKLEKSHKEGTTEKSFFKSVGVTIEVLNNFKWQYYDQTLNDDELTDCIALSIVEVKREISEQNRTIAFCGKTINNRSKQITADKKELGKFFSSKASLKERIQKNEEEISATEKRKSKHQKNCEKLQEQLAIAISLGGDIIEGKTLKEKIDFFTGSSFGYTVIFNANGTLYKNWAFKYFQNALPKVSEEETETVDKTPNAASSDIEERVQKLNALYEKKLITKVEFNKKRKEILSEL